MSDIDNARLKQYAAQLREAGVKFTGDDYILANYKIVQCICTGDICPGWKAVRK